jgi:hypothetical protein
MSVQIDRQPDVEVGDERRSVRRPLHFMWPLAIFLAMVIAGAAGVIVVQLTSPPTDSGPVYQEPSATPARAASPSAVPRAEANTREGRVPPAPYQGPTPTPARAASRQRRTGPNATPASRVTGNC